MKNNSNEGSIFGTNRQ